jgi:hypothetical protein
VGTNVSVKHTAAIFMAQDGGSIFFQDDGVSIDISTNFTQYFKDKDESSMFFRNTATHYKHIRRQNLHICQ